MAFNGSGSYAPPTTYFPIVNGQNGDANQVDAIISDIATALSQCVTKDGQQTVTANIPMNNFRFTGVGAGQARTDTATLANMQDGTGVFVTSVGGTANAITLSPSPAIAAYATGMHFEFVVATTNTAAVTVAISGLTAKSINLRDGVALIAGDLVAGAKVEITYDGTQFLITGGGSASPVTNATLTNMVLTNCTVTADPTADLGVASKQYVDAVWTTGDVKLTLKTTADSGWVLFNDGTIGSASSGATTRANADTEDLYTLIWNNTSNTDCAVSSGRGATASADFAANKTLALPKALGRALACYGTGSGLTARRMGQSLGAEDAIVVSHGHSVTDPGHTHTLNNSGSVVADNGATLGVGGGANAVTTGIANAVTGISIQNSGSAATGANMQPSLFLNVMVKL